MIRRLRQFLQSPALPVIVALLTLIAGLSLLLHVIELKQQQCAAWGGEYHADIGCLAPGSVIHR